MEFLLCCPVVGISWLAMVLLVIASWHMNFATSWQMIVASTLDFHDPLPAHCNIWLGVCCVCACYVCRNAPCTLVEHEQLPKVGACHAGTTCQHLYLRKVAHCWQRCCKPRLLLTWLLLLLLLFACPVAKLFGRNLQPAARGSQQIIAGMHDRQVRMCTHNSFPCR